MTTQQIIDFLLDFADGNDGDFPAEQIIALREAAACIRTLDLAVDELIKERDASYKVIDNLTKIINQGKHNA